MNLAPGFSVGHWTGATTGVTVVLCPTETVGSGEIRGGAPATRETALLAPERSVEHVDAVVFTGGSAFGLAAADGVMRALAERGRGFPTRGGCVPIVPTAAIYDLVPIDVPTRDGSIEPEIVGAAEGRAALEHAERGEPVATGRVGAGRGATVGKWRGPEHATPGGLGVSASQVEGVTIAALAVVNACGDVVDDDGTSLASSSAPPDAPAFPEQPFTHRREATTLVALTTDARLTKAECHLLAQSGHVGIARAVHPSHTRHDGDLVIALASGTAGPAHLDRLRVTTVDVTAEAIRGAVRHHGGR